MNSWSCSIASRSLMHAITVVFLALTATVTCSAGDQRATTASAAAGAKQTKQSVSASYGKLPLSFEANDGQTDSSVRFLSRSRDFSLFLTSNEAVLSLRENRGVRQGRKQNSTTVLRMRLLGANPSPEIEGLDKLASVTNYLVGSNPKQWRTHVPNYAGVKYRSLYPGVDVVFRGSRRELEYDFLVAAGSDPRLIRLRIDGANKTFVDSGGDLVLHTRGGDVRLHKLIAY